MVTTEDVARFTPLMGLRRNEGQSSSLLAITKRPRLNPCVNIYTAFISFANRSRLGFGIIIRISVRLEARDAPERRIIVYMILCELVFSRVFSHARHFSGMLSCENHYCRALGAAFLFSPLPR